MGHGQSRGVADQYLFCALRVLGGQNIHSDAVIFRQLSLQFLGSLFGEVNFLAAMAVDDEDLAAYQRENGFFCFQFGNQHITSSPLQRFCPS